MASETTGTTIMALVFEALGREEDATASELAQAFGAARATTFALVRQLERAGFIERGVAGRITPGPASAALGFAALGLGALGRAAEALLPALRDDTASSVDLVVRGTGCETRLMRRTAFEDHGSSSDGMILEEPIVTPAGGPRAYLRLWLRPSVEAAEQAAARGCLRAVAEALSRAAGTLSPGEGSP